MDSKEFGIYRGSSIACIKPQLSHERLKVMHSDLIGKHDANNKG